MRFIPRLALAMALATLAFSGAAQAQQQYDPGGKARVSSYCKTTLGGDTPCPASPSFSATVGGFAQSGIYTTLSAGAASARSAVPSGAPAAVEAYNAGTTTVSCLPGNSSVVAVANEDQIPAGGVIPITLGSNGFVACIDQTGSATNLVILSGGTGLGYASGGASAGSGGAVTNAGTFAVQLTGATNNINNISGTISLPTGAATAANQASIIAVLGTITDAATCATSNSQMACLRQMDADIKGTGNIQGVAASGATDSDVPLNNGGRAAGGAVTPVADGQKVAQENDLEGRIVTLPYAVKENWLFGNASSTVGTAVTLKAAQGSGIKIYVTAAQCFREDAGATPIHATLNDGAGTMIPAPAGAGAGFPFPTPLVVAANTALTFTMSSAVTTAWCQFQGFKGP